MIKYYNFWCQEWWYYTTIEWWMINYCRCFQRIQTTQERRQYEKDYFEKNYYGYKLRARRSNHTLPCNWDDKQISCQGTKNWKKLYKVKKQWMKPKISELF